MLRGRPVCLAFAVALSRYGGGAARSTGLLRRAAARRSCGPFVADRRGSNLRRLSRRFAVLWPAGRPKAQRALASPRRPYASVSGPYAPGAEPCRKTGMQGPRPARYRAASNMEDRWLPGLSQRHEPGTGCSAVRRRSRPTSMYSHGGCRPAGPRRTGPCTSASRADRRSGETLNSIRGLKPRDIQVARQRRRSAKTASCQVAAWRMFRPRG